MTDNKIDSSDLVEFYKNIDYKIKSIGSSISAQETNIKKSKEKIEKYNEQLSAYTQMKESIVQCGDDVGKLVETLYACYSVYEFEYDYESRNVFNNLLPYNNFLRNSFNEYKDLREAVSSIDNKIEHASKLAEFQAQRLVLRQKCDDFIKSLNKPNPVVEAPMAGGEETKNAMET